MSSSKFIVCLNKLNMIEKYPIFHVKHKIYDKYFDYEFDELDVEDFLNEFNNFNDFNDLLIHTDYPEFYVLIFLLDCDIRNTNIVRFLECYCSSNIDTIITAFEVFNLKNYPGIKKILKKNPKKIKVKIKLLDDLLLFYLYKCFSCAYIMSKSLPFVKNYTKLDFTNCLLSKYNKKQ
ncbi:putative ORFan [Cotonvirus japonicus]|uniref:ORFan n=1 Tax=Cotonvirus japonicus TaxID=2811091 RepID=A0ABM7NTB9_9VIRU|nr:putative ORFan [Cotonvirus japonicus]BCS83356.1 putative ORFan [Cotonvirus japonicus]